MGNSQHGFSEWLVPGLEIVAFRLSRANDCAAEIGSLISNWSYNGPLKFEQRVAGGKYKTVVADIRPIPPKVSLLFSEAVHHIRASLDNVVWFLIESQMVEIPPKLSKKIAMPIYESEEKFDQWARPLIKMGLSMLSAEAELGRSIRDLQP